MSFLRTGGLAREEDDPPAAELELASVERAPASLDRETRPLEHRRELVGRVDAQRMAVLAAAAVGTQEDPARAIPPAEHVELVLGELDRPLRVLVPDPCLVDRDQTEQVQHFDQEQAARRESEGDAVEDALVLVLLV